MIRFSNFTKKISTAAVAVAVLLFMCTVGALTIMKNRDTLMSNDLEDVGAKDRITSAFNENITGFDKFISVYSYMQKLMGTSVFDDAGYTYIIRDSENNFHLNSLPQNAEPYAEAVGKLKNELESAGVPMLFISSPIKQIEGYTKYPLGMTYASIKNAEAMSEALASRGVEEISLSDVHKTLGTAPETMFFRTDHHWTTEAAFASYAYVMKELASRYSLDLDPEMWNMENYKSEVQEDCFLGSIGRRVGREAAGLDDYTFIEPDFDTEFKVYNLGNSAEYPTWAGDFRASFVRENLLYSEDVAANRYASYFGYDFGHLIVKNQKCENNVRVAIVKDSFALPFTAFLSCAVSEVDMIDLREFEGSVTEYLTEAKPDVVLVLYSGGSFSDNMYEFDK